MPVGRTTHKDPIDFVRAFARVRGGSSAAEGGYGAATPGFDDS